jgi:rare lipoprotein A
MTAFTSPAGTINKRDNGQPVPKNAMRHGSPIMLPPVPWRLFSATFCPQQRPHLGDDSTAQHFAWLQRRARMRTVFTSIFVLCLMGTAANAAGWGSVHKYVKPTGNCAGQEILASHYSIGKRTANGERFDVNGNTAAARTWPIGTILKVTNPKNGRSITVRINDTGPWGLAYRMGARLDMATGAARRIGMAGTQYVCVA